MPNNKNQEIAGIQDVPQVRDVTAAKTVFMPAESFEEIDSPLTGVIISKLKTPETFLESLRRIIKDINRKERIKNKIGPLVGMVRGQDPKVIKNGGTIK